MAKRKDKKVEQPKGNIESQVGYCGNLNIKVMRGNRVVKEFNEHNTGTKRLFTGLALALIGDNNKSWYNYLPKFLGFGTNNSVATSFNEPDLKNPCKAGTSPNQVPVRVAISSGNPYVDSVGSIDVGIIAPFTAVIPYASIKSFLGDPGIGEFGLFSDIDGETLLARITLTSPITNIDEGMNLLLTWTLSIRNIAPTNTTTNT